MKILLIAVTSVLSGFILPKLPAQANDLISGSVVLNLLNIPAKSDQYCAPNGHRTPVHVGTVKGINNTPSLYDDFTFWRGSGWSDLNSIDGGCYVEMLTGAAAGYKFEIDFNNGTGIYLKDGMHSGSPSDIATGDRFQIVPKWTQKTLLQGMSSGTKMLSLSTKPSGTNRGAIAAAEFYANYGWLTGVSNTDDKAINVDEVFILRNDSNVGQVFWSWGHVSKTPNYRENMSVLAGVANDHFISFTGAMPVALIDLVELPENGDEMFFFDFGLATQNKGAAWRATYYAGYGWYAGVTKLDAYDVIEPGRGYILRKAAKSAANSVHIWSDLNGY